MNRRTFMTLASAGLISLPTVGVNAQRNTRGSSILSELSGAEIDISGTSFALKEQYVTESGGFPAEVVLLENDYGHLLIQFVSGTDRSNFASAYEVTRETLATVVGTGELAEIGSQELVDGGWMAFQAGPGLQTYSEMQLDAFPEINLWIELQVNSGEFVDAFAESQQVHISGMPPFLFMEESGVEGELFAVEATGQPGQGRTSTSSTSTTTMSANDVIEAVRDHQAAFHDELDRFDAVLAGIDEGADDAELFSELLALMFAWTAYEGDAVAESFPSELATLESAYRNWATGISLMGVAMGQWLTGNGEIEAFVDAKAVAHDLDRALTGELRRLGAVSHTLVYRWNSPDQHLLSSVMPMVSPAS